MRSWILRVLLAAGTDSALQLLAVDVARVCIGTEGARGRSAGQNRNALFLKSLMYM